MFGTCILDVYWLPAAYPACMCPDMHAYVSMPSNNLHFAAAYAADDYAPVKTKARWFAIFYLCIPVGFALGYIVGGVVASSWGWR